MNALLGAAKSKTMWAALAAAVIPFVFPAIDAWVAAHPGPTGILVGAVFAALRTITSESLSAKGTGNPTPPVSG
jgi:hypothetical protein